MRYQVAQMAEVRLQLEGRDGGLQRDLPRVHHPPRVQQVRRVQGLGQGAGQAQQHRLRRAEGHGRDQGKIRLGTGDDPRVSTAEMQMYTWEQTNANTTETLVERRQATGRRTARGHARRQGAGALARLGATRRRGPRRDLADDPRRHPRPERHRMAALPELPDRAGPEQRARAISARPDPGYDPNKCIFEVAVYRAVPERRRAADGVGVHAEGEPELAARCCRRTSRTWPRCSRG